MSDNNKFLPKVLHSKTEILFLNTNFLYCRVLRNHLIQSPHLTDEDTQIQDGGAVLLRITQAVDVLSAWKPHHMQLLILTEL